MSTFEQMDAIARNVRPGLPYPTGADRAAWEAVSGRAQMIADAKAASQMPYPQILATDFLAYVRTGSRQCYEEPYFARRHHLIRTAIGECAAWDDTLIDDVINGLWAIAEETSWVVSAHNVDAHPGSVQNAERPLPDTLHPVIDLFAAQTAATITLCCHLLSSKLDAVTPLICRRMRHEVYTRVLDPFFSRDDFWWMGMIRQDINNWTPWILSNILICLLYFETDSHRLSEGVRRSLHMLSRYMDTMPEDGGCDEGMGYWNMAAASLLDCLELLHHATDGRIDFYQDAKIRAMGAFPLHAHIAGPYYWNFADCDAKPHVDGERVWRFGMRTKNNALAALGQTLMENAPLWPQDTPQMARVLDRLFAQTQENTSVLKAEDAIVILPDLQVWARRQGRYYAAIKGGHNGESHNHNDVGNFIFYINGSPEIVDAGNMTYSAKTFSDARYTLWNTRSANHNVPLIGGHEQVAGKEFAARVLSMEDTSCSLALEAAYPPELGVRMLHRQAWLTEKGLRIRDSISLETLQEVAWVFLLRHEPMCHDGICTAGALRLSYPAELRADVEPYPVNDARMARNFPGTLYRLTLRGTPSIGYLVDFQMEENTR